MATYKILDDYELFLKGCAFDEVRGAIRADLQAGVVDEENYAELMADLNDEEAGFFAEPLRISSGASPAAS
jgi:hypothetical protein